MAPGSLEDDGLRLLDVSPSNARFSTDSDLHRTPYQSPYINSDFRCGQLYNNRNMSPQTDLMRDGFMSSNSSVSVLHLVYAAKEGVLYI